MVMEIEGQAYQCKSIDKIEQAINKEDQKCIKMVGIVTIAAITMKCNNN